MDTEPGHIDRAVVLGGGGLAGVAWGCGYLTGLHEAGVTLGGAASSSVPGAFPPVKAGGERFMDGGCRSGTNCDLTAAARRALVIALMPLPDAALAPAVTEEITELERNRTLVHAAWSSADAVSATARTGRVQGLADGGSREHVLGRRGVVTRRHARPPRVRGGMPARLVSLVVGLFICALGIVLILQANLGLSPWDVLHQGIADSTPLSFGEANIVVGVAVLFVAWRLGARIGLGTVANATLIGTFIQVLLATDAIPDLERSPLVARAAFLLGGIACFGVGSAFYIGADMGAGPRDSLMLVVAVRLHTRVSLARGGIELAALAAGWALGGDVGVGTVAFAVLIGPAVETAFVVLDRSPLAAPRLDPSRVA